MSRRRLALVALCALAVADGVSAQALTPGDIYVSDPNAFGGARLLVGRLRVGRFPLLLRAGQCDLVVENLSSRVKACGRGRHFISRQPVSRRMLPNAMKIEGLRCGFRSRSSVVCLSL